MSEQLHAANIELQKGELRATVMTEGAWLTNFENEQGPILYPYGPIATENGDQKVRGGCHVCLPNFGPDASSELAQHGFGRTNTWAVESQSAEEVTLALEEVPDEYAGLAARLTYALMDSGISMQLTATNNGQKELRLSPGFHPYFATDGAEQVVVGGAAYDVAALNEAEVLDDAVDALILPDKTVWLEQANLSKWVLWSDRLGDYVCLEPTEDGPSFQESTLAKESELLQPNESRSWTLLISQ